VSNALANFMAFSDQRVTFAVGETKTMAEITEARKTAADATSAVAEQVTSLKATVETNGQTTTAAITRIDKAAADLKSATASSIQEVKAEIGDTNAAVQTTSEAVADINGKLSAQWGVKVQVEANGVKRIAGIQLGIDGTGASNFLISADTFAVYNPTTNGQELVFASTGGQMFMRSVFIQDGSIDNGKIGNYIQSSNWDGTGNVGWHINKSGYATFNGVTVRGTIYATDGSFRGRVEATSGSFRGTVEATSFIGDVANTGVYPDSSNRSNNAVSTSVAMAYTDSSNNGLNKNAVVEALIYVRGATGAVGSTVNITIAGNVRTFTFDVPVGGLWFTARHAATGLTGQRIDASIFVSSSNATVAIYAPTITVTRGTGSFS
ncbi:phage tail tip fiber protein, partial [Leclercia adecarboxylata]|uniref:phage tail tip fiber protein n=3 Tax=Leclercia adecarboxylata TaxID=83655 RepID=UPI003015F080